MLEKILGENFDKLRDAGELLAISDYHDGQNCPAGKTLTKCNQALIGCIQWNPIGKWEMLSNGVLRLVSDTCGVTVYRTNGVKIVFSFSKGDLRYTTKEFLTCYSTKPAEFTVFA